MDISALASVMKHSQLMQQVSVSVAKMSMDVLKTQSADLVRAIEQSVTPHLGQSINTKV